VTKPHNSRPTILLTGFGPFPGVAKNVSAELIEALALVAAKRFPKRQVIAHVLPTEWQTAPMQLAALYKMHTPMLVLHFGVSKQATGFCIETQAHNTHGPIADAMGGLPRSGIISGTGPAVLPVSVPAQTIVTRLLALSVPAGLSHNAGTYLCNCVLYHSLQKALERAGQQAAPVSSTCQQTSLTRSSISIPPSKAASKSSGYAWACRERERRARRQPMTESGLTSSSSQG
jgi:pyroglutamyl-peptidase